ncbi:MAG: TIGR01212 family radical SAM protein [Bdellovibrionota bacterium]
MPSQNWDGKPYFPISQVYRQRFGSKVVKIPVSIAESCPNREGIRGMKTCIFCDVHGSFAYPESQGDDLRTQIVNHRAKLAKRFNATKFLVYFQAYTTTFTQLNKMKEGFQIALEYPDVAGIVVGTRPDTLSEAVLRFWKEQSEKTFVSIELGVQSFDDEQLIWMRRGHTAAQSIKGIEKVAATGLDTGLHLIFGWPTENDKQIIETARLCNDLPISNVKLHNLHVLKNTPLEELYAKGEFLPVELEQYSERVALFLDHLSPRIAVHRLAALSSRWDELIAPPWVRHKMKSYQAIIDKVNERGSWQGRLVSPSEIS